MEIDVNSGSGGCGCFGCFSTLFSMFLTVAITVGVFGLMKSMTAQSDRAAVDALNACPAATDALGSSIRERAWSVGCGESSSGGGSGHAVWSIHVAGSKTSGTAEYVASYLGGSPWTIDSMRVSVDDRVIQVVPCESAPEEDHRERERDGKAKRGDGDRGDGERGSDERGSDERDGKAKHKAR
jgi:hypothetical protein